MNKEKKQETKFVDLLFKPDGKNKFSLHKVEEREPPEIVLELVLYKKSKRRRGKENE